MLAIRFNEGYNMKKSLYRKIVFGILVVCLFLLIYISLKLGRLKELTRLLNIEFVREIFQNSYVCSILCSIIAVIIIYIVQVKYSKRMIMRDFRCNEIIEEIYPSIEKCFELAEKVPKEVERLPDENSREKRRKDSLMYYEFYKEYRADIEIMSSDMSYFKNDILIESVQSCFLINLNFELLSIVNNIKNRLPNIREQHPSVSELYEKYEAEQDERTLEILGVKIPLYLKDLQFLAMYWKRLLDYLGYDPTYLKAFIALYNSRYNVLEELKQPEEVRNRRLKEVRREAKKVVWLYQLKNFWSR